MRIQGIGPQWSDLLEAAGVDTVRELATRNPANLLNQIVEINDEKSLVRQLPTLDKIEDWVEQAKELPRILNY
jgi:predicted flap endonuclease-1-like 5' DNA nuclease